MEKVELIISGAIQVITCASNSKPKKGKQMSELGILQNVAIACNEGKIVAIETEGDIQQKFSAEKTLNAEGFTVIPGFVDPHTHLIYGGNRFAEFELRIKGATYLEIMQAGGGIVSTVTKTRAASEAELVSSAKSRLDDILRWGTTTVEIKTGYGLDIESEMKMLRVSEELSKTHTVEIVPTFLAAHAIPAEWKGKEDLFTELICDEMIPKAWEWYASSEFCRKGTPFFVDVFCEEGAFNLQQTKQIINASKSYGFQIKAHVDEFTNLGGAAFVIREGATSIDHLDATSDDEIAMLAASETIGIVTPTVNFNLGSSKFANARKIIDKGAALAVSTDFNPGSAPCPSQPMAMAIACRYQKLMPSEALNAVTINAAFGVGLGKTHGSIELGKSADFLFLETKDYRELSYEFPNSCIKKVIKKGKVVYESA
ncbi:MAG: imidazolonepropionase [Pyrinomonadaceae bacterium]